MHRSLEPVKTPFRPRVVRRIRSMLLGVYKAMLLFTGFLPDGLRIRIDTFSSCVLLRISGTPVAVLKTWQERLLCRLLVESKPEQLGDYLEFGVCCGSSLASMYRVARRHGIDRMRFFGFDSFAGLPEAARTDDGGYWSPRMFMSDFRSTEKFLTRAGIDWRAVTLVKGWFSETLKPELMDRHNMQKASVIMVDCDMYLSASQALEFCEPLIIDQAVIIFDDWYSGGLDKRNMGEKRAFEEFLSAYPDLEAEPIGSYSPNAKLFMVRRTTPNRKRL